MSPPDSTSPARSSYGPKAQADIYTVMLILAFLALLVGILMFVLELNAYNFDFKGQQAGTAMARPAVNAPSLAIQTGVSVFGGIYS